MLSAATPAKRDRINCADRQVRVNLPAIVADMIERAKAGDKTSLELLHKYYVQPMREDRDRERERERSRSAPTIPASVTGALTRFKAVLVAGETLTIPARPSVTDDDAQPSVTIDATVVSDATGQPAPDASQSAQSGEAAAKAGGVEVHVWDPSRPLLQEGGHANGPMFDENGLKLCERCGHPITDRKKVRRAHFCLACAEAGRKHSLAESARKQAERRAQRKLQEEHDAKGPR